MTDGSQSEPTDGSKRGWRQRSVVAVVIVARGNSIVGVVVVAQ